jgi:2-polyprenyl-6-methoxyphenol hydroxylase-like FAD-dependent oxidoreductase
MAESSVRKHWTQPVTGAGLNINPNALAALKRLDPELEGMLRGIGLPRESVRASTVAGRQLYEQDIVEEGLADTTGCRVRWDDANTLIRREAGDCIKFEHAVEDQLVCADGTVSLTLRLPNGSTSTETGFDLLVAGDGRYSAVRSRAEGTPETTFGSVTNFRILVPNAQADGTAWPEELGPTGLFDDLQLIYNESPTVEHLAEDSVLRQNPEFTECVLRSSPRVGIMRIPRSKFKEEVGESLYIFGNFAIPPGGAIPDSSKSAEAMRCLFTPAEGEAALTPEGAFIREILTRNADSLHWARFQDFPVQYTDQSGKVLMLGDAAHAFCPSLGQGATTSIEDACVASSELCAALHACEGRYEAMVSALPDVLAKISDRQAERVAFIRDLSTQAGEHVRFFSGDQDGQNALDDDAAAWTDESHVSGWRRKVRRMWLGYPVCSSPIDPTAVDSDAGDPIDCSEQDDAGSSA